MPKGLTFEQTLQIAAYTAFITFLLTLFINWLKNKLDFGLDNKKFKREFASVRLKELYLQLYAVIAQSEFVRNFHNIPGTHEEIPFLEINKSKKTIKSDLFSNKVQGVLEQEVKDAITEFNKIKIANLIIEKGQFASQELLKLAVSYRYIHPHYQDESIANVESFRNEELRIIARIVNLAVKETNQSLKLCMMDYNKREIKYGLMVMKDK